VAFVTVAERKGLASLQRRVGPNVVGPFGLIQAFADARKLILKELILPKYASGEVLVIAPVSMLICSLLLFAVLPLRERTLVFDFELSLLMVIALTGLTVYGILYGGWASANSYALMGAIRSGAQVISYELSLSTGFARISLLASSLSMVLVREMQEATWFLYPLLPMRIG